MGKNLPANARDLRGEGSIPGLERSHGGGHSNPPQYSCLENLQGQRNQVGFSPWGRKESDMGQQLSIAHQVSDRVKNGLPGWP